MPRLNILYTQQSCIFTFSLGSDSSYRHNRPGIRHGYFLNVACASVSKGTHFMPYSKIALIIFSNVQQSASHAMDRHAVAVALLLPPNAFINPFNSWRPIMISIGLRWLHDLSSGQILYNIEKSLFSVGRVAC